MQLGSIFLACWANEKEPLTVAVDSPKRTTNYSCLTEE